MFKSFVSRVLFALHLSDTLYLGDFELAGWYGKLPFYLFKCHTHGWVIAYPSGYHSTLICPQCLLESL